MYIKTNNKQLGFTLVELAAVIMVIALLSAITMVSYTALLQKSHDTSSLSAIDSVEGIVQDYALKNNLRQAYYYSGTPADVAALGYEPSDGVVVDVVTNDIDYCIRAFKTGGTKDSIYNAFTRGSSTGACSIMQPSSTASIAYTGDNLWTQVSSSYQHTCAIDAYGAVYCWGLNDNGQLGNGNTTPSNTPVAVNMSGVLAGRRAKAIVTGYWHTCIIASDDLPYCWGAAGRLGDGAGASSTTPIAVKVDGNLSGKTVQKIVSSWAKTCVLASDNYEYCWGNGDYGSLGWNSWVGGGSNEPVPVYMGGVLAGKTIKDIFSPGDYHSCAIASDNRAYCWGWNLHGQLGIGNNTDSSVPVAVNTSGVLKNKRILSLSTNDDTTCVVASDNKAYCWGSDVLGSLGDGGAVGGSVNLPVAVDTTGVLASVGLVGIAKGFDSSVCAYSSELKHYCWGLDDFYQLGDATTSNKPSPIIAASINNLDTMMLYVGFKGDCLLTNNYSLYCWGQGSSGRIGVGNNNNSATPALIVPIN